MKGSPILFNGDMVRAILDGRKTQTRRILKSHGLWETTGGEGMRPIPVACPMGKIGDRLYVRETFKPIASGEVKGGYGEVRYGYAYQADGAAVWRKQTTIIHDMTGQPDTGPMQFKQKPWKPSIHMPQAAARIWLEITDVRIDRLHAISEVDAAAEGVKQSAIESFTKVTDRPGAFAFRDLWMSAYSADSWESNPWVWAITFKRVTP